MHFEITITDPFAAVVLLVGTGAFLLILAVTLWQQHVRLSQFGEVSARRIHTRVGEITIFSRNGKDWYTFAPYGGEPVQVPTFYFEDDFKYHHGEVDSPQNGTDVEAVNQS